MAVKPVWVVELNAMLLGWVGAVTSVVTLEDADAVEPPALTALTTSAYAVFAVNPANVTELDATPLSAEGVATEPFSVYV
jgi:hypothetical protein